MQKVTLPIVSTRECRDLYDEKMQVDNWQKKAQVYLDRNICAGGEKGIHTFISIPYDTFFFVNPVDFTFNVEFLIIFRCR